MNKLNKSMPSCFYKLNHTKLATLCIALSMLVISGALDSVLLLQARYKSSAA